MRLMRGRKRFGSVGACAIAAVLLTSAAAAVRGAVVVDPDAFPAGTVLNNAFPGVTLTALGDAGVLANRNVLAAVSAFSTTGSNVFADTSGSPTAWGDGAFSYLRADFAGGATSVSMDYRADDSDDNAFLRAFNSANVMVAQAATPLNSPVVGIVTLTVTAPNIAYITASWDDINRFDNGILDHLVYQPVPEPGALGAAALAAAASCLVRRSARRPRLF